MDFRGPGPDPNCAARAFLSFLVLACSGAAAPQPEQRPWARLVQNGSADVDADRRLQQTISGLEYVLSGYDIFFGNPSFTRGSVDPGFRKPIFAAHYDNLQTTPDGQHFLPKGISTLPCEGSCTLDSDIKAFSGASTYKEVLDAKVWASVSFMGENVASFSASFDYQRIEEGARYNDEVYTVAEATCCAYRANLLTFRPPPVSPNFRAAVEWAPVDYNQQAYFALLAEFGTHFVSSAQMGAVYGQESSFKKDKFQQMISLDYDWWVSAKTSFLVTVGFGAANGEETREYEEYESFRLRERMYSLGQKPPLSGDLQAWIHKIIESPMPTGLTLQPLSDLFDPRFVDGVQDLTAKRYNMMRALGEYCEGRLVKEGFLSTCSVPPPDPPIPDVERICLAKVDALGGPLGEPFDDSVDAVTLHGFHSSLQVSEIKYRADSYVDHVQLVLAKEEEQWPLSANGGRGGRSGTIHLESGARITSVEVRHQRYVDRLIFYESDGTSHSIGGEGGDTYRTINFKDSVRDLVDYNPRSAWLVGLFGRAQRYVDSVGFYVAFTCRPETPQVVTRPAEGQPTASAAARGSPPVARPWAAPSPTATASAAGQGEAPAHALALSPAAETTTPADDPQRAAPRSSPSDPTAPRAEPAATAAPAVAPAPLLPTAAPSLAAAAARASAADAGSARLRGAR